MAKQPLFVAVGDTHLGGLTALCPPVVELDDGGAYHASVVQLKLYEWWGQFWDKVRERRRGRKLVVIHLGDLIDGNVHKRGQSIPNLSDQKTAATTIFSPILKLADEFYLLRGTEAHVGDAAKEEVDWAKQVGIPVPTWELHLNLNGVVYDLSHHGTGGGRPWTSKAATIAMLARENAFRHGYPVPRFVLRAHSHMIDDSGERVPGTRAIITPAWQLRNAYAYKVAADSRSDIGGIIIDGESVEITRYMAPLGRKLVKIKA